VYALNERRAGEDARTIGSHAAEEEPGDRGGINGDTIDARAHDDAAAGAFPSRARVVNGDDIAFGVEEDCFGRFENPGGAAPGVDLHADGVTVEMDFVASRRCDARG